MGRCSYLNIPKQTRRAIHRLVLRALSVFLLLLFLLPALCQSSAPVLTEPDAKQDASFSSPSRRTPPSDATRGMDPDRIPYSASQPLRIPEIIAQPPPKRSPPKLPPPRPEIRAYNRTWYALYFLSIAWTLLGLGLMIRRRVGPRLRDWIESRPRSRLLRAALFYAAFSLLLALWRLPLSFYGYQVERAYGFATLSPGLWLLDRGRGYLFDLLNIPAVWVGYWLLERSPKRWWLWLWLASIPWTLSLTVLYPVVIAPAYNDFKPLRNAPLRDRLLKLASRAGIEGARVYEVDISRRTTKLNAYVAGLGPTKRIVLWDTTLHALSEEEILAIVGHEMGHYVLGHVWWNFAMGVVGAFVILGLLAGLLPCAIRRFGRLAGIRSLHDLAGLPLVVLLLTILLFLQTPIESAWSRFQEHQADRFAVELTGLREPLARAFIAFVQRDFADPDPPPFLVFWFYSHPPIRQRIDFVLNYQP